MHLLFWIWLVLVLKLPVAGICWFVYRVANDTPEQVIGEGEGGSGVTYEPGPRTRGPREDKPRWRKRRRGHAGREDTPKPRVTEPSVHGE